MSGHSRWSQVKHKKALTDARKGQLFSKMVREIMVAARSGGPDPNINSRLRTAMERAKQNGLPKDNIERAQERARGGGDAETLQEFLYEVIAEGAHLLIDGITDNNNRTLAEIKQIISKHGAKLIPQNSILWNFEKIWSEAGKDYRYKQAAELTNEARGKLTLLMDELVDHPDVQEVYSNLAEEQT